MFDALGTLRDDAGIPSRRPALRCLVILCAGSLRAPVGASSSSRRQRASHVSLEAGCRRARRSASWRVRVTVVRTGFGVASSPMTDGAADGVLSRDLPHPRGLRGSVAAGCGWGRCRPAFALACLRLVGFTRVDTDSSSAIERSRSSVMLSSSSTFRFGKLCVKIL